VTKRGNKSGEYSSIPFASPDAQGARYVLDIAESDAVVGRAPVPVGRDDSIYHALDALKAHSMEPAGPVGLEITGVEPDGVAAIGEVHAENSLRENKGAKHLSQTTPGRIAPGGMSGGDGLCAGLNVVLEALAHTGQAQGLEQTSNAREAPRVC